LNLFGKNLASQSCILINAELANDETF